MGCGSSSSQKAATGTPSRAVGTLAPQPTQALPPTPVVTGGSAAAIVNGHRVPMSEFRALLVAAQRSGAGAGQPTDLTTLSQQTMTEVIVNEIGRQYAATHHITVSRAEVDAHIQRDVQQLGGTAGYQRRLAQLGLTDASYRQIITLSLIRQKVAAHVAPFNRTPHPVAHVRDILVSYTPQGAAPRSDAQAHALASQLLTQLKNGADFATLARQRSDDQGSAQNGGDLGNVYPHVSVPDPAFDQAVFRIPLNRPTLVRSGTGYYILEVLSRGKALLPANIQQGDQQQRFSTWMQNQLRKARIVRIARVKT